MTLRLNHAVARAGRSPSRTALAVTLLLGGLALPCSAACASADRAASTSGEDGDDERGLEPLERRARAAVETPPAHVEGPLTIHGATVLTAAGERFEPGYLIIVDGRIEAVGEGDPPTIVGEALDAAGRFVTPGLIDAHSHIGVYPAPRANAHGDGNEMTNPNTGQVWAENSFWPQDPSLQRAAMGGVTTLHVLPGSANVIGGRGVTLRARPARGARAMRFPGAPDSLKMACGENPKRVYGTRRVAPQTRMGVLHAQRQAFAAARAWLEEQRDKPSREIKRDLANESLAGVLEGRILAQVHCYRADDMLSFLQIADEFGVRVRAFHHATEAYKIRDILAARGIAVATWADWWGFKLEAYDAIPENLALIQEANARAILHSDSAEGIQRLNQEAGKAYWAGVHAGIRVDEDQALRWITANPAWALGIDAEVGTLSEGKRADLVIWDRHPFSVYARAERVYIDGLLVHDASQPFAPWSDFELGQEPVTP